MKIVFLCILVDCAVVLLWMRLSKARDGYDYYL